MTKGYYGDAGLDAQCLLQGSILGYLGWAQELSVIISHATLSPSIAKASGVGSEGEPLVRFFCLFVFSCFLFCCFETRFLWVAALATLELTLFTRLAGVCPEETGRQD